MYSVKKMKKQIKNSNNYSKFFNQLNVPKFWLSFIYFCILSYINILVCQSGYKSKCKNIETLFLG